MNRKINVRLRAIAVTVMALAMLTALVTKAAAQASQLQNLQPGYVPQTPPQGAPNQTLTLPQVAPQAPPPAELPPASGQEGSLEVPQQRAPEAPQEGSLEQPERSNELQPGTIVGRISVTATDQSGRWIQDLGKQDLNVYEDGVRRPVLGVQRDTDTPVTIGIVVDTSGSMDWKLAAAEAALQHFVRTMNRNDQFFLIAFSNRAFLLQDFTNDPAGLNHAIGLLYAKGQTALFDAVVQGLQKVEQGRWPKKALLVMTDGMDNESTNSLDTTIDAARRAGVLIYTVGLGTTSGSAMAFAPPLMTLGGLGISFGGGFGGGFGRHGGGPMMGGGGGEDEMVDASTLRRLSDETGATTFVINPRVTDMSALDAHFQQISAELRQQYTVRYASAGGGRPHQIRVDGTRDGMEVRAPKWTGAGASDYGG